MTAKMTSSLVVFIIGALNTESICKKPLWMILMLYIVVNQVWLPYGSVSSRDELLIELLVLTKNNVRHDWYRIRLLDS